MLDLDYLKSCGYEITPDGRMSRVDAAKFIGVSYKTLENWAVSRKGPPSYRVGGKVFYRLAELDRFIREEMLYSSLDTRH